MLRACEVTWVEACLSLCTRCPETDGMGFSKAISKLRDSGLSGSICGHYHENK